MNLESRFLEEVCKIFEYCSLSIKKTLFDYEIECVFWGDWGHCYGIYELQHFDDPKQAAIKLVDEINHNRYFSLTITSGIR